MFLNKSSLLVVNYILYTDLMTTILNTVQIIIAILLMIAILMQQRGSGLGAAFGGGGEVHMAKRGAEKFLYNSTIALAVIFLLLSLVRIILF